MENRLHYILLIHILIGGGKACDNLALQEMQEQFMQCAVKYAQELEDTRNNFPGKEYVEEAVCNMFENTVQNCGKAWGKCHTPDEVQHLRDSHLESLLAQYKDINLDHCRIVQNFLSSGRRQQIIHHLEKCPSEEMTRMQEKFQSCSHDATISAHQQIRDVTDDKVMKKILCDTLNTIGTVCKAHLQECFNEDDVIMMTESHVKEMKKFLVQLTRGRIEVGELEYCSRSDERITDKAPVITTTTFKPKSVFTTKKSSRRKEENEKQPLNENHPTEELPVENTSTSTTEKPKQLPASQTISSYKTKSDNSGVKRKDFLTVLLATSLFFCFSL